MADDFDLFPKRENLDPFSFGTKDKEKAKTPDDREPADLLFEQEAGKPSADPLIPPEEGSGDQKMLPDEPADPSREATPEAGLNAFGDISANESDEIFGESPGIDREPEPVMEGPIPDDQSGYGPRQSGVKDGEEQENGKRKPSPFIVIGGALVLILGLLWGALTYLQKERKVVVPASVPPASAKIEVPKAPAKPVLTPEVTDEVKPPASDAVSVEIPEKSPAADPSVSTPPKPEPVALTTPQRAPSAATPPSVKSAQVTPSTTPTAGDYSVQVGAFILKSSVQELQKELLAAGLEPFLKEGSTQAMMHFLTAGPFDQQKKGATAVSELRRAGIESNLQRVSGGGAVVHAGSYLLEKNAREVMSRIRSLGYPVRLTKKETRLPMTFVRVGQFPSKDEASRSRDELKNKGFDAIVVKLQ
jgi:cell division septation protein DedD